MREISQRKLIVGAGFAGAAYARELAEGGLMISVIDKRSRILAVAHDKETGVGIRPDQYGQDMPLPA